MIPSWWGLVAKVVKWSWSILSHTICSHIWISCGRWSLIVALKIFLSTTTTTSSFHTICAPWTRVLSDEGSSRLMSIVKYLWHSWCWGRYTIRQSNSGLLCGYWHHVWWTGQWLLNNTKLSWNGRMILVKLQG